MFPAIEGAVSRNEAHVLGSFGGLRWGSLCQALSPRSNDPALAGTLLTVGAAGKDHPGVRIVVGCPACRPNERETI